MVSDVVDAPPRRSAAERGALPHPGIAAREASGKNVRGRVPRSAHGKWTPASDRRDPVELLEEQSQTRVRELVPIRYGRMLVSPFTFFRGAAYLMAADLAPSPRSGLEVQLCGDAHLLNFGAFAAPDRRLVFGLNDFDETLPGPFEWDVKRLVASFEVAARDRRFGAMKRASITMSVGAAYRTAMREFAAMRNLDVFYARIEADEVLAAAKEQGTRKQVGRVERNVAKARAKDSLKALAKLAVVVDGQLKLVSDPPLVVPIEDIVPPDQHHAIDEHMREIIRSYRGTLQADRRRLIERFEYVALARKVVGVGSVGTRAWIMLLRGRDAGDPLFLQFKEAQASVLEGFLGRSPLANHGQRVVEGQQLLQGASDILLGWTRAADLEGRQRDFYVRQLWDSKGSALVELMDPRAMTVYARLCGRALAKAHARSGDPIAIASYLGSSDTFDRALCSFAAAYADQNERDHRALREAVARGRVTAQTGV